MSALSRRAVLMASVLVVCRSTRQSEQDFYIRHRQQSTIYDQVTIK